MFYLASSQSSVVPLSGDDDSLSSAIFEFVFFSNPQLHVFSHHIFLTLSGFSRNYWYSIRRSLVWSNKEEETCLIDMCDQHEAIV
jgi:hypothetical protein